MTGAYRRWRCAIALSFALSPCALALDPALDVSQYAHKAWKNSEGFAKGIIYSLAQTPDGYLWLGTDFGLLRFDGVRPVEWAPPAGTTLPSTSIRSMLVTRDGTLWIGTVNGLASWKGGRLTEYSQLAGSPIAALIEDHAGSVWVGALNASSAGRLCAIRGGDIQCYGKDGRFGFGVISLYEFRGELWAGSGTGLWRWKPDPPKRYPVPQIPEIQGLIEGDNGSLWLAAGKGIRQLKEGIVQPYRLPAEGQFTPYRMLRDRDRGLWIGTFGQGILHAHEGTSDVFGLADGLSGDRIYGLLEDREGSIWAATNGGLDRFSSLAASTISVNQGLSPTSASVLAARDGSLWIAGTDGLNRWNKGRITIYRKKRVLSIAGRNPGTDGKPEVTEVYDEGLPDNATQSLLEDDRGRIWVSTRRGTAYFEDGRFVPVGSAPNTLIYSMAEERDGSLWIAGQSQGLFHLLVGKLVEQVPWAKLGHKTYADAMVADPARGGLWLGFYQGGVTYFEDGKVRASYTAANGLGDDQVSHLRLDREGSLWAATAGGLSRLKDGRITTITSKNGLPCDATQWSIEDDAQSVWLGMACGVVRIARPELDAWVVNPERLLLATVFDTSDGVKSFVVPASFSPRVTKSKDGKLWFNVFEGVSVIDPRHLAFNQLPPPVEIAQIIADRKTYAAGAKLPPLVREVEIDYTALSLVAPEKNRFKYKLEGRDRDWHEVGNRRQAFYDDLPPRHYRFRVMAANNSGVWNEAGALVDFSVASAYYQTNWFRALAVAAVLALLAAVYQLRLLYLKRQFNIRFEERVNERLRLARDLHDTLLQSFQGVLLKFHAVTFALPDRPTEARTSLESAIELARQAVTEGRDAVQGLRSSTVLMNDLARAITTFGEGLASDQNGGRAPEFRVEVEGTSRDLPPILRDEVYRITGEALRNAFRHAGARRIEVEIHYDKRQLRVRIRDDGKGIDLRILQQGGRAGHHGLPGMQERARLIGGKLTVWSELNSGTEIELTIPAAFAYARSMDVPETASAEQRTS